jgi:HAD superfamily hydrolase (TIGR01549 family)
MQSFLNKKKVIFWDFDGVIKDSVEVKTKAFEMLFKKFGDDIAVKVVNHHTENGGMSRFDKIPLYLEWAGVKCTQEILDEYCSKFALLVEDAVVNSAWIEGVEKILNNKTDQLYILVTATPQDEIMRIVKRLSIESNFSSIYGAPTTKAEGIRVSLEKFSIKTPDALMIGDAKADLIAAQKCGIDFLLRRTPENEISMPTYKGNFINNFLQDEPQTC